MKNINSFEEPIEGIAKQETIEEPIHDLDARQALAFFKRGDEIAESWFRAITRAVISFVKSLHHPDNIMLPYYCIFLNDDTRLYHEVSCYGLIRRKDPKPDSDETQVMYTVNYQESYRNDPSKTCSRNFGEYTEEELIDLARNLARVESLNFYK